MSRASWLRLLALLAACSAGLQLAVAAQFQPFDAGSMKAIGERYAGRPFVVAFWSITCEPCRDELRDWKAVQRKHPRLPLVLVNTDPPSDREAALEFLARYSPGAAESWAFASAYGERIRYAVDPKWRGELPRTYFHDAARGVVARSGRLDPAWIDQWVESGRHAGGEARQRNR